MVSKTNTQGTRGCYGSRMVMIRGLITRFMMSATSMKFLIV